MYHCIEHDLAPDGLLARSLAQYPPSASSSFGEVPWRPTSTDVTFCDGSTRSRMPTPAATPRGSLADGGKVIMPRSPDLDDWCRAPHPDHVWQAAKGQFWQQGLVVYLYVVGCTGLFQLFTMLGVPLFKIGLTTEEEPSRRIGELNSKHHASHYLGREGWQACEGFDDWEHKEPVLFSNPSPLSVVSVTASCLRIELPAGMSFGDFDKALNRRLAPVSLDRWARRLDVKEANRARGVDPCLGIRGTSVTCNGIRRVEDAYEIFLFRKRREFPALVAIAEDIVLEHLRQEAKRREVSMSWGGKP